MLLVLVMIPLSFSLLFQSPIVQTLTARLVADALSKNLEQTITINGIKIGFFSGINIIDLNVSDHHGNTMLGIGKLSATPIYTDISLTSIDFVTILIDEVEFNMGTYKNEGNINFNMLINSFRSGESSNSTSGKFELFSNTVELTNSRFNLFNQNKEYSTTANSMDYADILIDSINISLSNFRLVNDSLNFEIISLSGKEKCGICIEDLSADFILGSTGLHAKNAIIKLNNSILDLDFRMEYNSFKTMSYFVDSVVMIGDVHPTTVDMADIGYFSEVLFRMPNELGITGKFKGTVTDLEATDLRVKYKKNTRVSGDMRITGLPDFFSSYMTGDKLHITTNTEEVKSFYLPIESKHIDLSNILPFEEQFIAIGNFAGYYEDFKSNLDIILSYGKINSEIEFNNKNSIIDFTTNLKTDSLNIGEYLNQNKLFGRTSFDIKLSGTGRSIETIKYAVNGKLTDSDLMGYNYSRIKIDGKYQKDSVIANVRVGDKNLMMEAHINAAIKSIPEISLNSRIVKANLKKLNLWSLQNLTISSNIDAKIRGTDINTLNAHISLRNNKFKFHENEYDIDSIILSKTTNSHNYTSTLLNSNIINIEANGEYSLSTITNSFIELLDNFYSTPINETDQTEITNNFIDVNIDIPDPKIFSEQFLSGIEFAPHSSLNSKFDFTNKNIDLELFSDNININDVKLDSNSLKISTQNNHLLAEFSIDNLILKDSTPEDSIVLGIDNFSVSSLIGNDSVIYGISWNNRNQTLRNIGELEGYIATRNDSTKFNFGKAVVFINDLKWSIDTNNLVLMHNDRVYFKNFFVVAGDSEFKLIGTIPKSDNDSLVAQFKDWELSNFDLITKPLNITLDGKINGDLKLTLIENNPTLVSNISILELGLNDEYLGNANIINTWDNSTKSIFIKSNIIRKGNAGQGEIFKANGYYYPFKKDDNLNIDIAFDKFKLETFEPFLTTFVNELEGSFSSNLEIRGSVKKPVVTGSVNMQRAGMRVVYLNTKYSFSNSIDFVENGVKFDKLVIYDTLGNQANITGSLTYNYFKDPKFKVNIKTPGLLFFNTSEHMNDLYYGSAIASGNINIEGTPSDIDLNIDVSTQKGTSVTLPLNYSVEISDKDYIIFVKKATDTIFESKKVEVFQTDNSNKLNYDINVGLNVTPIAQVGITLPDDMGDISARGNSNLALDVDSDGKFSLIGDYIVEDGVFQFKIGNLVSKRFTLVKGGRISWSGNPYSAQVNIKGMYKVKTSLTSLGVVVDSTVSHKNNVTVECYVVLTDELLNPNIKFEIKIPNLDPDFQRAVFSELDTTNTAMMNQQMISLLVLGSFSFNNASNISLQSSYYNVIANQLSSMLSQISDNVDVGLNYKPGDAVSQQEFEVALSTQLFDDRLTIDGNFGMSYDRSTQAASNIVGDVDIGYKLTPDGQWVLKVFNHSNVNSWYNYNNYDQTSPYTQGVGIAFRKEFNNISDFFKSKKKNSKKKKAKLTNKESIKKDEDL